MLGFDALSETPLSTLQTAAGGVTDTPVSPGAGSIAITGYAPTVDQSHSANPGVGSIQITGYAPTVAQSAHQSILPGVGSIAITGYAPTVTQQFTLTMTVQQAARLEAVMRLHGLIAPLVITPTSRSDGTVTQTLSGAGPVTVHTTGLPTTGNITGTLLDNLSRWYGLIDDIVESDASRTDGTLSQTVVTVGSTTTLTTV